MIYGSVCSGIEAASVAWEPLGWRAAFFSEIEKFPSAVLAHHYGSNMPGEPLTSNGVPNLGDMNNFKDWPDYAIDLLVGGTPCQSFSVAGLRKGLDDPRGNLMLVYAAIARRYRPKWLVWENVCGVLSDDGGRGFASLLGLLSGKRIEVPSGGWQSAGVVPGLESAYGLAWRVLDAQHVRVHGFGRAVPQRRRRVFVVGHLGDWRRAAAVLLERASLRGDPAPRREAGQAAASTLGAGLARRRGLDDRGDGRANIITQQVANPLTARMLKGINTTMDEGQTMVAYALRADGFDASEDGTGRGTRIVSAWRVRRLMPVECERLQGFPDAYTAIPYRGKPAADGPRYRALGNSMACNVMRWIGKRIEMVEEINE